MAEKITIFYRNQKIDIEIERKSMNIFKWVHERIDNWLHKEESEIIFGVKKIQDSNLDLQSKQEKEFQDALKAEIELISKEDHSVIPTKGDIDRYYAYHVNFVTNIKKLEKYFNINIPTEIPLDIVEFDDYYKKSVTEGWEYLRKSCGLPLTNPLDHGLWNASKKENVWTVDDTEQKWTTESSNKSTYHKRGM